jgi:hypothetical protein
VAVALIFGTQAVRLTDVVPVLKLYSPILQDIVRVWMFWKKNVPATPVPVKEYKSWFDDM